MSMNKQRRNRSKSSERFLDKEAILRGLNILPGQTILDLGCGTGYMSREFSRALNHTGTVYAVDPNREAIEALRSGMEGTNIKARVGDISSVKALGTSSMDIIYLSTVLHIFPEDQILAFQKEAKRLLKPGAILAIVEIEKKETPFGPPLRMRLTPEDLKRLISLVPLATVDVGEHFYMQLFENPEKSPVD